jgi:hypothetical protein
MFGGSMFAESPFGGGGIAATITIITKNLLITFKKAIGYLGKYVAKGTTFVSQYSVKGTTFTDQYSAKNTKFKDLYPKE